MHPRCELLSQRLNECIETMDAAFGDEALSTDDVMTLSEARANCADLLDFVTTAGVSQELSNEAIVTISQIEAYTAMVMTELSCALPEKLK